MIGSDLYVKLIDPTGSKKPVVNHHRVWDGQLFLASQRTLYEVKPENPADKRIVSQSTEADYRAFMGYKEKAA